MSIYSGPMRSSHGFAPQSIRTIIVIDALIYHIPRVHTAGVVFHYGGDVVCHHLLCVRRCHIGVKPVRQGIPPDQAMATEELRPCCSAQETARVTIREIIGVGSGPQMLGEL